MKRMKRVSFGTLTLVGLFTAAAMAWFVLGLVEGTGTTTTGKSTASTVPIKVTMETGVLTPTAPIVMEAGNPYIGVPISLEVENTAPGAVAFSVTSVGFAITTSNEGACPASDFNVNVGQYAGLPEFRMFWEGKPNTHAPVVIPAGVVTNLNQVLPAGGALKLTMSPSAPTGCETVQVSVTAKANHS